jgi:hypothetical protein
VEDIGLRSTSVRTLLLLILGGAGGGQNPACFAHASECGLFLGDSHVALQIIVGSSRICHGDGTKLRALLGRRFCPLSGIDLCGKEIRLWRLKCTMAGD